MFFKYEVKNNGNEDILYLYLNMSYEFAKEINSGDEGNLEQRASNFIKNKGINFSGDKVFLVVNDIVVKTLNIANKKSDIEILSDKLVYSNNYFLVNVKLDNNSIVEMTLSDYLIGAIASNITPDLDLEVLKCLAILYRTYAFKEMQENNYILATNEYLVYKSYNYYKLLWLDKYDEVIDRIKLGIEDTDCIFVTYDNYYILPFIHLSNNGFTNKHFKYKYLENVRSLWDLASPNYINVREYSFDYLANIFKCSVDDVLQMKIISLTPNNRIGNISISNNLYSGKKFAELLNLDSEDVTIIFNKNSIKFITKGIGEFYGLSLFGSNEISKNGGSYTSILSYYFPHIKFNKYIKEFK